MPPVDGGFTMTFTGIVWVETPEPEAVRVTTAGLFIPVIAAALRAVGYTKDSPNPPGGEIQRDKQGNPTGLLLAKPNANILYSTLAKGPTLSREDQLNSSRLFFREFNSF